MIDDGPPVTNGLGHGQSPSLDPVPGTVPDTPFVHSCIRAIALRTGRAIVVRRSGLTDYRGMEVLDKEEEPCARIPYTTIKDRRCYRG